MYYVLNLNFICNIYIYIYIYSIYQVYSELYLNLKYYKNKQTNKINIYDGAAKFKTFKNKS